ncbi:MAG TPA: inorganic phosphate transporter [Acidimicrobiales bacterium]
MHNSFLLVLVIIVALAFDFTNGFHDTANAVAPTVATGALKPRVAVLLSSCLNLVGAFLSLKVAATVASGIVQQGQIILPVVFGGLIGAIAWNVTTWYFGIPSSSSHALIGGVVGAMMAHAGGGAVIWGGITGKVLAPSIAAPIFALLIAALATTISRRLTAKSDNTTKSWGMRLGQIGSSSLLSIAHGTNDAQKTMGVITLALVANGTLGANSTTPKWVVVLCGIAIALGTFIGGWRIIRTMGQGFTKLSPTQGFASQVTSSVVILSSSHLGMPLSTTYVATGSILGSGVGTRKRRVHWSLAGRVGVAWLLTLPCAAVFGAASFYGERLFGYTVGVLVMGALLAIYCTIIFFLSRRDQIHAGNVNDHWGEHLEAFEKSAQTADVVAAGKP